MTESIHASVVCHKGYGVLLHGASGSGKSTIALRLIAEYGAELVGDDYVNINSEQNQLIVRPVPALAGLIEARGLGVLRMKYRDAVPLRLAIRLVALKDIVRLPEQTKNNGFKIGSICLPELNLNGAESTTPLKIIIALAKLADNNKFDDTIIDVKQSTLTRR